MKFFNVHCKLFKHMLTFLARALEQCRVFQSRYQQREVLQTTKRFLVTRLESVNLVKTFQALIRFSSIIWLITPFFHERSLLAHWLFRKENCLKVSVYSFQLLCISFNECANSLGQSAEELRRTLAPIWSATLNHCLKSMKVNCKKGSAWSKGYRC